MTGARPTFGFPQGWNLILLQICFLTPCPRGAMHTSEDLRTPACHPSGGKFLVSNSPRDFTAFPEPLKNLRSRGIFPRRANDNTAPVCFQCRKEPETSAPRSHLKDNQAEMLAKQLCGRRERGWLGAGRVGEWKEGS